MLNVCIIFLSRATVKFGVCSIGLLVYFLQIQDKRL